MIKRKTIIKMVCLMKEKQPSFIKLAVFWNQTEVIPPYKFLIPSIKSTHSSYIYTHASPKITLHAGTIRKLSTTYVFHQKTYKPSFFCRLITWSTSSNLFCILNVKATYTTRNANFAPDSASFQITSASSSTFYANTKGTSFNYAYGFQSSNPYFFILQSVLSFG